MKDYTNQDFRNYCPKCKYPMLRLRGFEGTSSADNRDLQQEDYSKWAKPGALSFLLVGALFKGLSQLMRKSRIAQKRKAILPQYPNSLICPQCFTVTKKS